MLDEARKERDALRQKIDEIEHQLRTLMRRL